VLFEFMWRHQRADKHARFAKGNLGCTWWGATVSLKQSHREGEVRLNSASVKTTKKFCSFLIFSFSHFPLRSFFPCHARVQLKRTVHTFPGGCYL